MQKKELIGIALCMDNDRNYESFYRFAQNFAFHLEQTHISDNKNLFECISFCGNRPREAASRLGISGKNTLDLQKWCEYILRRKELKKLSLQELQYVFGCCARACKAKNSKEEPKNNFKNNFKRNK